MAPKQNTQNINHKQMNNGVQGWNSQKTVSKTYCTVFCHLVTLLRNRNEILRPICYCRYLFAAFLVTLSAAQLAEFYAYVFAAAALPASYLRSAMQD